MDELQKKITKLEKINRELDIYIQQLERVLQLQNDMIKIYRELKG